MTIISTEKISETSIKIVKEIPTPATVETTETIYERSFIEQQILDITAQRDEMIALKEKELLECQEILDKMDELEIVSKVEEEITNDIQP